MAPYKGGLSIEGTEPSVRRRQPIVVSLPRLPHAEDAIGLGLFEQFAVLKGTLHAAQAHRPGRFHHLVQALVNRRNSCFDGSVNASVAHHVAVGEVHHYPVVLAGLERLGQFVLHFEGRHLGRCLTFYFLTLLFVQKLGKGYGFGQKLIVFRPNVG